MTVVDRIQGLSGSLAIKVPCRAATTANITLSGLQTVDGVSLVADDRVLVKNQTTASQNGIYLAGTSTWQRSLDFDGTADAAKGTLIGVTDGTVNANSTFELTTANPILIGTSSLTFVIRLGSATFIASGAGAVTLAVQTKLRDVVSVKDYGALGDGSTDDRGAFALADTASLGVHVPAGTYKISSNITLGKNYIFEPGAILKPDTLVTVTINGAIQAGAWQIFDATAASAVVTGAIKNAYLLAEWWGAAGVSAAIDTPAWQATLKAAKDSGYITVRPLARTYLFNALLYGNGDAGNDTKAPSIRGIDKQVTIFDFSAIGAGASCLYYEGGSGTLSGAVVEGVHFLGHSTSTAVEFAGKCGMKLRRCKFTTNAIGVLFHNKLASSFTEYDEIDNCEFTSACVLKAEYRRTSGNDSFHGSGFTNRCLLNHSGNADIITITHAAAYCYNCPLDAQVWLLGASTANLINSTASGTSQAHFFGTLTIETNNSAQLTLGATNTIYFSGEVMGLSLNKVLSGTLLRTAPFGRDSASGVRLYDGVRKRSNQAMTTGANTILSPIASSGRLMSVQFTATNYDYRYLLAVTHHGDGTTGTVVTVATLRTFNTAGYGAPTFTVDTSGNVIATNAGFPASGVTAIWEDVQLSARNQFGSSILYL